jgi:hypothetical protein
MKEQLNQNQPIKGTVAFFMSPEGVLFQVEGGNHISTVIRNPSKFGVTTEQVEQVYDFFGEKLGVEGVARKQILTQLIRRGWIRLRRYPNKYWSVNVPALTDAMVDLLQDWAAKFLSGFSCFQEPDPHMPVVITFPFGKPDRFSMKEISKGALSSMAEVATTKTAVDVRFFKRAALLPDSPIVDESGTALEPRVGIFFLVDFELIVESVPVSEGKDDGDFVNGPRSHSECWDNEAGEIEKLRAKRVSGKSYDYYPRGRCLYSKKSKRFCLYVDPCIDRYPRVREELLCSFQIPVEKTDVILDDPHYRCSECNPLYVPDPYNGI